MSRFLVAAFVGLTIAATVSTSASAFHCVAASPNGASGAAFGVLLVRAQSIANAKVHTLRRKSEWGLLPYHVLPPVLIGRTKICPQLNAAPHPQQKGSPVGLGTPKLRYFETSRPAP